MRDNSNMLRNLLGEDDFWAGVTQYLETYSDRVVETADFRHVLEQVSDRVCHPRKGENRTAELVPAVAGRADGRGG